MKMDACCRCANWRRASVPTESIGENVQDGQAQSGIPFGPMLLRATQRQAVVLSEHADDTALRPLINELERQRFAVVLVGNAAETVKAKESLPNLCIVDARGRKAPSKEWDPLLASQEFRNAKDNDSVAIAVVDRRLDSRQQLQFVEKGVSQTLRLSSSAAKLRDTLRLLEPLWAAQQRLRATAALFAALELVEVPVEIADASKHIQFVNGAYERATGWTRADLLGAPSSDTRRQSVSGVAHHHDAHYLPPLQETQLIAHSQTDQTVSARCSVSDSMIRSDSAWHCVPVPSMMHAASSSPHQLLFIKQSHPTDGSHVRPKVPREMSMRSVRHSSPSTVEAPITEVLSLLREVQQNQCLASVEAGDGAQQPIADAIRILSSSDVYAPLITRFGEEDRVASDLFDGLIGPSRNTIRHRKKSVVEAMRDVKRQSAAAVVGLQSRRVSTDIDCVLAHDDQWHFDVFELERLSDKRTLVHLGLKIFDRWKVSSFLQCDERKLHAWLTDVQSRYRPTNPYHNATHAADVLQATSCLLSADRVAETVEHAHAIAALIAAAVHDIDHPGKGNAYLVNSRHPLAVLYNDISVLENHHAALAFQLTLNNPKVNIFSELRREDFANIRQSVIEMILATDMRRHFECLAKFQQSVLLAEETAAAEEASGPREGGDLAVCRMLIKVADVSNPARPWALCTQWAARIVDEYFAQTDDERANGLPLTMELFDRHACNISLTQLGFIDMFAREMLQEWSDFAGAPHLLSLLQSNYEKWQEESKAPTTQSAIHLSLTSVRNSV